MTDIFEVNPYESHQSLSPTEADVLWEYAKLAQHVKDLTVLSRRMSELPDSQLLGQLRGLENRMGLVLTLFKASVWAVINEQPTADNPDSYQDTMDATIRQ